MADETGFFPLSLESLRALENLTLLIGNVLRCTFRIIRESGKRTDFIGFDIGLVC